MSLPYRRLADASATVGFGAWLALALADPWGWTPIPRLLALAPLVLVPVGLGLVATPTREGRHSLAWRVAVLAQPPAAVLAVAALALPRGRLAGLFALPWLGVAGAMAAFGLWRLRLRGPRPVEELAVDAGLLYLPVGATGLALDRVGATLGFEPVLVVLGGVHFHYAGFVLPVLTRLAGRTLARGRQAYRPLAAAVVAGPAFIAVGITFSPVVELVAVAAFTVAVALLAVVVLVAVVPARPRAQALAVGLSALVLPASMLLALGFGVSEFLGRPVAGLTVPAMVGLHGRLNALGFALLGAAGWRLSVPAARVPPPATTRWRPRARE